MKVLMFGWEFPPFSNGGLGTACQGLTKGLKNNGIHVTFVLPKAPKGAKAGHVNLVAANRIILENYEQVDGMDIKEVETLLLPYISYDQYDERYIKFKSQLLQKLKETDTDDNQIVYGKNLYEEVYRYSQKAGLIAKMTDFDIIHAHDWLTYKAGIKAKKESGKPLVIHVHATEFDRTGGHPNQYIYDIEREGMHEADSIIAVSNFTKAKIVEHYGVPAEKVTVIHNAVEFNDNDFSKESGLSNKDKVVLFLGRLTMQKGPEYFLEAAHKVLQKDPDIKFVVAGSGDMENFMIEKAAELGISNKVLFSGFLRGADIDRAYQMASTYVMPSISEPFGITPLESMRNGTPTIISKQSGVSEVVNNTFKVDFWDVNELANKMYALTNFKPLHQEMSVNGKNEAYQFSWDEPARKCIDVYQNTLLRMGG